MDIADLWYEEVVEPRSFSLNRKGYAVLYAPDCPFAWAATKQMYRCRYVAWAMGWLTDPLQVVHHRDRVRLNDRPSNLEVLSLERHQEIHAYFSPETRRKISEGLRGRKLSAETRRKLREANLGNTYRRESRTSASALANMRAAYLRRNVPRERISATLKRRYAAGEIRVVVTDEQKQKIRRAKRKLTDDQVANVFRLWRSGVSASAIARQYGMARSGISKMLKRYPELERETP